MLEEIWSLAKARLFVLYKPSLLEKVDCEARRMRLLKCILAIWINKKSTYAYLLVQARINLHRCFFVASQLNNPRLLGGVLLYFFVGVSSAAYTEVRTIRAADE